MNYYKAKKNFSKTEDGTYDLNGNPVSFSFGYQVSFERPTDRYTEAEYNATVDSLLGFTQGAYIGVWEGTKELSFYTTDKCMAIAIGAMHNQDAVWDWAKMEAISLKR